MNRGSYDISAVEYVEEDTSMRPRFMNRGSDSATNRVHSRETDFNEAPIHESGK